MSDSRSNVFPAGLFICCLSFLVYMISFLVCVGVLCWMFLSQQDALPLGLCYGLLYTLTRLIGMLCCVGCHQGSIASLLNLVLCSVCAPLTLFVLIGCVVLGGDIHDLHGFAAFIFGTLFLIVITLLEPAIAAFILFVYGGYRMWSWRSHVDEKENASLDSTSRALVVMDQNGSFSERAQRKKRPN